MANELILRPDTSATIHHGDQIHGDKAEGDLVKANSAELNFGGNADVYIDRAVLSSPSTKIQRLLTQLAAEREANYTTLTRLHSLQCWYEKRSVDGVDGLQAKMEHVGYAKDKIDRATEYKEDFYKLIEEWSLYPAAQKIFANCLAEAEGKFNDYIHPNVDQLPMSQIDMMVSEHIVAPIAEQFGEGDLDMDRRTASGMVYWLAEHCHIRWHK